MDTYSLGYFTWLYLSLMLDVSSLGLVYGCFISCFVRLVGKQKSPISASQNMLLPLARAIKNGSAQLHYRRFRNGSCTALPVKINSNGCFAEEKQKSSRKRENCSFLQNKSIQEYKPSITNVRCYARSPWRAIEQLANESARSNVRYSVL